MRIWQRAAKTPWAITEDHLRNILDIATRQNDSPEAVAAKLGRQLENTYEVEYRDGVAILSVEGPLFRYANLFTQISGATSYERLAQDFNAAIENDQVRAVLLNINSPGGEADGNAEFAEMIYKARGAKPIVAYVGGMGASAAYWIASAADEVVAHETALLGSIGVRTALIDDSARMEAEGFKEYVIVSSQSPNKDIDPSNASDRGRVQQIVDDLATVFVAKVARNRGTDEDTVLSDFGQGDVLVGVKAVEAGLADRLGSFEEVLAELAEQTSDGRRVLDRMQAAASSQPISGSREIPKPAAGGPTETEVAMKIWLTDQEPAAGEEQRHHEATAANISKHCPEAAEALRAEGAENAKDSDDLTVKLAADKAATAERERVAAILGCEEAKGREGVAQELATTEGMTLEQAQKILAATPKAVGNQWLQGMKDVNPGLDGPDSEGDDPAAYAKSITENARSAGVIR